MGCFFIQQENVHFLFYEEIWEADKQHKRKKRLIPKSPLHKPVSSVNLKDRILMHKYSVFQIFILYSNVARTVPVLYYFRKVSFRLLGKETFKLVKTFIISVQDSLRCYFVLCTPWLAQGGKGRNQHGLILVL